MAGRATTQRLRELIQRDDNRCCADCGAAQTDAERVFASLAFGAFLCGECAATHRAPPLAWLTVVRSVVHDRDGWDDAALRRVGGGNACCNALHEAFVPPAWARLKPSPDAPRAARARWARAKYVERLFLLPGLARDADAAAFGGAVDLLALPTRLVDCFAVVGVCGELAPPLRAPGALARLATVDAVRCAPRVLDCHPDAARSSSRDVRADAA